MRISGLILLSFMLIEHQTNILSVDSLSLNENNESQILNDYHTRSLGLLEGLEMIIDTCGQSIASGAIKLSLTQKENATSTILKLRNGIIELKQKYSIHANKADLIYITKICNELYRSLNKALSSDLKNIQSINFKQESTRSLVNFSIQEIITSIEIGELQLMSLIKKSHDIGLSNINKTYRSVRKIWVKYNLTPIIERTVVYGSFCVWLIFLSSPWRFDRISNETIKNFLKNLKKKLGGFEFSTENSYTRKDITVIKDSNGKYISTPSRIYDVTSGTPSLLSAEDLMKIEKQSNASELLVNTAKIESQQSVKGSTSPNGLFNKALDLSNSLVDIDKGPLYKLPVSSFYAYYFAKDWKNISAFASKIKNKLDGILFGSLEKTHDSETALIPTERFDNIVGRSEIKAKLKDLVEYICAPNNFDRAGIKVGRGYLLAGDPQTGKTMMARALAGEISSQLAKLGKSEKVKLIEINTDDLLKNGIANYMELAKQFAPCILFLDEIDLLRLQRTDNSKLLSEFLTSMSGSLNNDDKNHVIILAATNRPECIDFALRQHGRFGTTLIFENPKYQDRFNFFKKELEKRSMNTEIFDIKSIATQTEGCSFGTLDALLKKSLMNAKISKEAVCQKHFDIAIDSEVRHIVHQDKNELSEVAAKTIATHFASQSIISLLLNPSRKLEKVTILPVTQKLEEEHPVEHLRGMKQHINGGEIVKEQQSVKYGAIFTNCDSDTFDLKSRKDLIKECKILLSGNIAQSIFNCEFANYNKEEKRQAFDIAKSIIFDGLSDNQLSKDIIQQKLTQSFKLISEYEEEAKKLLTENRRWLDQTIKALIEKKSLTRKEIEALK